VAVQLVLDIYIPAPHNKVIQAVLLDMAVVVVAVLVLLAVVAQQIQAVADILGHTQVPLMLVVVAVAHLFLIVMLAVAEQVAAVVAVQQVDQVLLAPTV
jgi:hypothetical protein